MIITSIAEKNKSLFQNLIPKYILEGITETNRFGIGLLNVDEKEDTA